jgi:NADH-quinone oxidoreductase subunit A
MVYLGMVLLMVAAILVVSHALGEKHRARATGQPYESGIPPTDQPGVRLSIKYYLVAMLFLIFDVEAVFIFVWAPVAREVGWNGFAAAAVFIGVLLLALFYISRVGALEWPRTVGRDRRGTEGGLVLHALETQEAGVGDRGATGERPGR